MKELFVGWLQQLDIELPENVVEQELLFLEEMLRWNQRINLTSINDREEALEKHLVDSLAILPQIPRSGQLLDMGSGGGFPGIPLAIARPELQVVSVDSVGKKISFQKHVKRTLGLDNLQPLQARLEALPETLAEQSELDLLVARAFAPMGKILQLANPCLGVGGKLLAMKGPEGEGELIDLEKELPENGFYLHSMRKYCLPMTRSERQLFIFEKS